MTAPGPPPSPAAVHAAHQARWDAASQLVRVTDHARELRQVGRLTDHDRAAVAGAEQAWDTARGIRPATRAELDRLAYAPATGGASW